jgi:hypothetical protein
MVKNYKIVTFIILASVLLTGCYKKELDEFKKASLKNERDMAFPLFESTITLNDSLPFTIPAIAMSDTIKTDFSFSSYVKDYSGKLDYVEFKIGLKSNFPVTGGIQFYFADKNGQIIDSLFTYEDATITAASGGNYNETVISSYMDHEKYKKIETAPKLYILYRLQTFPSEHYSSNELQIKSGIRFGMTF